MTSPRPTGRPELPLTGRGPLVELARELRELRHRADVTYRELGDRVNYSPAALSRAAAGDRRPTWPLVSAVVSELGGDLDTFRELWERTASPHDEVPPEPATDDVDDTDDTDPAVDLVPAVPLQHPGPGAPPHDRPDPVPVRRSRVGRRPGTSWVLLAVIGLLGGLAGFAVAHVTEARGAFLRTPSASIVSPAESTVPQTVPLYGTYVDLPSGSLIWAATQDPVKNRYFPQDKPCAASDGAFTCGIYYVGRQDAPDRSTYRVLIVRADAGAVAAFVRYQLDKGGPLGADPGLELLPGGAEVLAAKTVTRM